MSSDQLSIFASFELASMVMEAGDAKPLPVGMRFTGATTSFPAGGTISRMKLELEAVALA